MITIIVCSVKPQLLEELKNNIANTIGVNYELLSFDNRADKKGICTVYNDLANKASHDILCFAHEDILFNTNSWGKVLVNHLKENEFEVIGIAGSKYKSAFFSGWYTGNKAFDCANILHRFSDHDEKNYLNPDIKILLQEVVCLDGVFICCKKEVWRDTLFDENNLRGFHFYDIDFSLRSAKTHKVAVTYEIDMVHLTEGGDFGNNWIETSILYHELNRQLLPFTKLIKTSNGYEIGIANTNLDFLKSQNISWKNKMRWVVIQKLYQHTSLYYSILKFLFYRPLKLNVIHKFFKK
jgi:hypothetical protein